MERAHAGWRVEGVNVSVGGNGLFADEQAQRCAKPKSDQYILSNGISAGVGAFLLREAVTRTAQSEPGNREAEDSV